MFGAKDNNKAASIKTNNIDTILGEACEIKGNITSKSSIKLDGRIEGNVSTQGVVIIAQKGAVVGDVSSKELVVYGSVEGTIHADSLHLQPTARIVGEINAKSLQIEAGAVYQGAVNMKQQQTAANTGGIKNPADATKVPAKTKTLS